MPFPPLQIIKVTVPIADSTFVYADMYGNTAAPTAGALPLGIYYDSTLGTTWSGYAQFFPLGWASPCLLMLGSAVRANTFLQSDSQGRGIPASGNGAALAIQNGAADDYIQVLLANE